MSHKNSEGYHDPTAGEAISSADRPPKQIAEVIRMLKGVASLAGFDVVGKIRLRDRVTGKEW